MMDIDSVSHCFESVLWGAKNSVNKRLDAFFNACEAVSEIGGDLQEKLRSKITSKMNRKMVTRDWQYLDSRALQGSLSFDKRADHYYPGTPVIGFCIAKYFNDYEKDVPLDDRLKKLSDWVNKLSSIDSPGSDILGVTMLNVVQFLDDPDLIDKSLKLMNKGPLESWLSSNNTTINQMLQTNGVGDKFSPLLMATTQRRTTLFNYIIDSNIDSKEFREEFSYICVNHTNKNIFIESLFELDSKVHWDYLDRIKSVDPDCAAKICLGSIYHVADRFGGKYFHDREVRDAFIEQMISMHGGVIKDYLDRNDEGKKIFGECFLYLPNPSLLDLSKEVYVNSEFNPMDGIVRNLYTKTNVGSAAKSHLTDDEVMIGFNWMRDNIDPDMKPKSHILYSLASAGKESAMSLMACLVKEGYCIPMQKNHLGLTEKDALKDVVLQEKWDVMTRAIGNAQEAKGVLDDIMQDLGLEKLKPSFK